MLWIKIKRKNGRKRQIRDTQICDFELDVWSGLNNFLKNCKSSSKKIREQREEEEREKYRIGGGTLIGTRIRRSTRNANRSKRLRQGLDYKWAALVELVRNDLEIRCCLFYLTLRVHNQTRTGEVLVRCVKGVCVCVRARSARRATDGETEGEGEPSGKGATTATPPRGKVSGQTFVITRSFNMSGISVRPFNAWPASKNGERLNTRIRG